MRYLFYYLGQLKLIPKLKVKSLLLQAYIEEQMNQIYCDSEHECDIKLVDIFDDVISPRNTVIYASKISKR